MSFCTWCLKVEPVLVWIVQTGGHFWRLLLAPLDKVPEYIGNNRPLQFGVAVVPRLSRPRLDGGAGNDVVIKVVLMKGGQGAPQGKGRIVVAAVGDVEAADEGHNSLSHLLAGRVTDDGLLVVRVAEPGKLVLDKAIFLSPGHEQAVDGGARKELPA